MDQYLENQAVEEFAEDSALDDAAQGQMQEADDGAQALSEALAEFAGDTDAATSDEEASSDGEQEQAQEKQPAVDKGLKGRLNQVERRGYARGQQEARAAWEAERAVYEAKLAKYAEMELQQEAKKLAADENISEAIAIRLLRAERGMPAKPQEESKPEAQPRGTDGRFVARQQEAPAADNTAHVRAEMLMAQAETIRKATGVDVLEIFQNDADVKRKVASGEWDFADVAAQQAQTSRKRAPSVVRSPNSTGGVMGKSIQNMSSAEFEKLDDMLSRGYVFDASK